MLKKLLLNEATADTRRYSGTAIPYRQRNKKLFRYGEPYNLLMCSVKENSNPSLFS